jgi:uncharacterized protein (DUF488 family)
MRRAVFTVGHSTHPASKFFELLRYHAITAIADVRSQPYSRVNPQFNREVLRASLKDLGMSYVFLGRELGARSDDRSCYLGGKVQYDRLAQTALFQDGIARIEQGISNHRIALMCAEKDPLACHRSILVCRHLVQREIDVQHILADGRLESHEAALARLLSELDIQQDLFRSRSEVLNDAYARRGEQIAYVAKPVVLSSGRASR